MCVRLDHRYNTLLSQERERERWLVGWLVRGANEKHSNLLLLLLLRLLLRWLNARASQDRGGKKDVSLERSFIIVRMLCRNAPRAPLHRPYRSSVGWDEFRSPVPAQVRPAMMRSRPFATEDAKNGCNMPVPVPKCVCVFVSASASYFNYFSFFIIPLEPGATRSHSSGLAGGRNQLDQGAGNHPKAMVPS